MRACLVFAFVGLGCSSGEPPDLHVGGEIAIKSCGYSVKTRDQASRPLSERTKVGTDPRPFAVHLGAGGDASTQMTVAWRTRDNTTEVTQVQLGTGGKTDRTVEGFTFVYEVGAAGDLRMHEAHLCGLQPDTEYSYRVGGKDTWSPVYTFRTAPDRGTQPDAEVLVLVLGDSRGSYATWGETLAAAQAIAQPDLVMFSGDAVVLGSIQEEWDSWFEKGESILPTVPMVFAHGNHEANTVHFFSQFALPGDEEFFGVDFGPLHLAVTNDTPASPNDVYGRAVAFLDKDLAAAAHAPFRVSFHHTCLYTASRPDRIDLMQRELWEAAYQRGKVDLDLAGHDHNYERTKPINGIPYVISGGAGAPLYSSGMDANTHLSESVQNFILMRVRRGMLQIDAYRLDGTKIDSFSVVKSI
jgi:acid phosphatase type 7